MLLSTFSHYNGIHLLCNMYVLWSFSDPIIKIFGKEQFFGVSFFPCYKFLFIFSF